jgi:HlyD family secretion protein
MNKKLLVIIGLVVLVVAVPLINARVRGTSAVEVEVEKLEPRVIQSSVLASGKLVHEEEVKLTTEEIGRVTAIYVAEGQKVKRGELVLQIDDQRLKAAVEQQQASVRMQEIAIQRQQLQVENLQTQWDRQRALNERKLINEDAFTTATNNLKIADVDLMSSKEQLQQARALLDQQEDRLSKTRVYAPIDGTITTLDIKVGETAIASSTNFTRSSTWIRSRASSPVPQTVMAPVVLVIALVTVAPNTWLRSRSNLSYGPNTLVWRITVCRVTPSRPKNSHIFSM